MLLQPRAVGVQPACCGFYFYLRADLPPFLLTYGLYEGGAGRLDHDVRVQQDRLQQGLRVGRQLGHHRSQSQVDPQAVVRKLGNPEDNSECQSGLRSAGLRPAYLARMALRKGPSEGGEDSTDWLWSAVRPDRGETTTSSEP